MTVGPMAEAPGHALDTRRSLRGPWAGRDPGHAFMQNLRRGHYELGIHALPGLTVAAAFDELAREVRHRARWIQRRAAHRQGPAARWGVRVPHSTQGSMKI